MGKEFTNYNFDDSEYVERLYATIFGRDSDASGKKLLVDQDEEWND